MVAGPFYIGTLVAVAAGLWVLDRVWAYWRAHSRPMNKHTLARISSSSNCGELLNQNASLKKIEDLREVRASTSIAG
jgi:hypothetical protein